MSDKIIKATAKDGQVRIIAADTTNLVRKGTNMQKCSPTASAALGRMLTAAALMGSTLKGEQESLTLKINGGGIAQGVSVSAYDINKVKGYIGNPNIDLPLREEDHKLNVGGAIGKDGNLVIIRDMGLKEPYIGQVPIYTGEIGDDIAYYYTVSEQTPSAVVLGVLVGRDSEVSHAGGIIIQMLPDADPLLADLITYRLEDMKSLTGMLSQGKSIEDVLYFLFDDLELDIKEISVPEYKCDCSRERVERALMSIGVKELEEIQKDNKVEELTCHFCDKVYEFTPEDIAELIERIK